MNTPEFIEVLFRKYLNNQCTPEEIERLLTYFDAGRDETLLKRVIGSELDKYPERQLNEEEDQAVYDTLQHLRRQITPVRTIPLYKHWSVRAAALVAVMLMAYLLLPRHHQEGDIPSPSGKQLATHNALPGTNKATLTLSDGSIIALDSLKDGVLAQQGNAKLINSRGTELTYQAEHTDTKHMAYNTVATPKGGQYQLVLADGSKVWLNASSSLRFPTSFDGKERRVTLTGEGYFEIAQNSSMPFRLEVNGMAVDVLGTHFNVMAYEDEDAVRTSLLEGSVKVSNKGTSVVLRPGQQSQLEAGGSLTIAPHADIEQAVAWKNGIFQFSNADIRIIMRQLSRWYDVNIVYEGSIPNHHFEGQVSRSSNLSNVLKILEYSGVHCRLEGKKLIVLQ